jgi:D-xylose transport system substrate-binding protein
MNSSPSHFLRALCLSLILLSSCWHAAAQTPEVNAAPIKIAFLVDSLQVERWQRDAEAFRTRAGELGATVVVESADGNDETQLEQANQLLASGIRAIVLVAHDTEKAARIVAAAKAQHVPLLCYERLIPYSDVDFYAGPYTEKIGELQATSIIGLAPKGNYILVEGSPVDFNAKLLHQGQRKILQPLVDRGDIHIVAEIWAKDWSPIEAYSATSEAIAKAHGDIAGVIASNDGTAGGAIQALEDAKLAGKVPVSGQDADLAAIVRILNGTQSMTIYRPLSSLAAKTAEVAVSLARGQGINAPDAIPNGDKKVPAYLVGVEVVTRSNVMQTVIKDGFQNLETIKKSLPPDKWPQ